jgi:hypothetical protein
MSEVKVGQIWASTHRQDVEKGERQHRVVTHLIGDYAYLRTEGSPRTGSTGVRMRKGAIPGHRLVSDAERGPEEGFNGLTRAEIEATLSASEGMADLPRDDT